MEDGLGAEAATADIDEEAACSADALAESGSCNACCPADEPLPSSPADAEEMGGSMTLPQMAHHLCCEELAAASELPRSSA
jgi:hypothetical protein